jgi:hypothetical protein
MSIKYVHEKKNLPAFISLCQFSITKDGEEIDLFKMLVLRYFILFLIFLKNLNFV